MGAWGMEVAVAWLGVHVEKGLQGDVPGQLCGPAINVSML